MTGTEQLGLGGFVTLVIVAGVIGSAIFTILVIGVVAIVGRNRRAADAVAANQVADQQRAEREAEVADTARREEDARQRPLQDLRHRQALAREEQGALWTELGAAIARVYAPVVQMQAVEALVAQLGRRRHNLHQVLEDLRGLGGEPEGFERVVQLVHQLGDQEQRQEQVAEELRRAVFDDEEFPDEDPPEEEGEDVVVLTEARSPRLYPRSYVVGTGEDDLRDITGGIGWFAILLQANGFRTIEQVAGSSPEELATATRQPLVAVQSWVEQAQQLTAPPPVQPQPPQSQDDLTQIRGIGPTFAGRLIEAGIDSFAKVAASSPEELAKVTQALPLERKNIGSWIGQARDLAGEEV